MHRWLYVCRADELTRAGSYTLFELGRESVIVVRGHDDEIRAFHNICRHRGTRLCKTAGETTRGTFRCPYHAWSYGLDGRLLGAPHMADVVGFDRADYPLIPVASAVWEGGVFINFADAPTPFAEAFAPIHDKLGRWQLARLCVAARRDYDIAANWKLIFENYVECYHCPIIHPALDALTPYREADNDLATGEILGGPMQLRAGAESLSEGGARCGPLLVTGPEREQVYYYTVFPALFLALHPDYVVVYRLDPVAIDRTLVRCQWLFDRDYREHPDAEPERAVAFWDRVNHEDQELVELAQQGVLSRAYIPGPYAELESLSAEFDRTYLDALGDDPDIR